MSKQRGYQSGVDKKAAPYHGTLVMFDSLRIPYQRVFSLAILALSGWDTGKMRDKGLVTGLQRLG